MTNKCNPYIFALSLVSLTTLTSCVPLAIGAAAGAAGGYIARDKGVKVQNPFPAQLGFPQQQVPQYQQPAYTPQYQPVQQNTGSYPSY